MNKYINTPFSYTGSKFNLLSQIIDEMDYTKEHAIDLFCGGGSIYTNIVDKYKKVLANDIISDLIGIHKGLLESDEIIEKTKELCPNKDNQNDYIKLREDYNKNKTPEGLWSLMLCCNSNLMRFNKSGDFNQTWGNRSWNKSTEKKVIEFTEHIRQYKDKIIFSNKNFNDIKILKPSFIYADPPYGYSEDINGNITKTQISEAGYNVVYKQEMDIQLHDYLLNLNDNGSTFMLSGLLEHNNNKSWLLNQLIRDGFRYKELIFDYDKISKKGKKNSVEIIIMNY